MCTMTIKVTSANELKLPVLYSFRRCPYAIRARMALAYAGISFELREIVLRQKPPSMLAASAKGTVPVLVLPDGRVIDESFAIMNWALDQNDPRQWRRESLAEKTSTLVKENDFGFKTHLDHYKYADRFPERSSLHYRSEAEEFLQKLEHNLGRHRFLLNDQLTLADAAIFPFVRQFAFVDKPWFDKSCYHETCRWLGCFLESNLFSGVMGKYAAWREGDPVILVSER